MAFPTPDEILKKAQGGASSAPLLSAPVSSTAFPSPQEILDRSNAGQPSFGSNLISKGKELLGGIGRAVGGFFGRQAENVKMAATGELDLSPSDFLEGVKQTAKGLGTGAGVLAQGINEGVIRIGKSLQQPFSEAAPDIFVSDKENSPLSKAITGRDSTPTLQDIYAKSRSFALDNNASIDEAGMFGGLVAVGSLFADLPVGPGGFGKGAFKLSETAIKELAESSDEAAIKAILKRENPELNDTQLEGLAPVFRNAANDAEVRAMGDQLAQIQKIRKSARTEDLPPSPDELLTRSRENIEIPKSKAALETPAPSSFFRALPEGETTRFVPVEGQAVKVMDGLDTFVHKTGDDVYEVMEATTGRAIGRAGATPEEAVQNARNAVSGRPIEEIKTAIGGFEPAPRGASTAGNFAVAQQFDRNLIRAISEEKMPGPVLDRLTAEFPSLSPAALAPIAKRLAKLKRTGDIEGLLQVIRNIDQEVSRARTAAKGPIAITKENLEKSIAKVGERKAVGDLPEAVGELLTPSEATRYLAIMNRTIDSKEQAILAQQEYDALWEFADQRIIDRYEELKIQRDMIRDYMDSHPGHELNNLYRGTFLSPKDVELDEMASRGFDQRIDEIMGNAGGDVSLAQRELDTWFKMREDLAQIEKDLRVLRPKAKGARILQTMVEDVPILSRRKAGEIEALSSAADVRGYKDISGFMGQARDVYRNFEKFFGDRYEDVKRVILDPFDKSKGEMVDEIVKLGDRIEANVVKKYGINRGSKESAAIQLYGEGQISTEELRRMVGDKTEAVIDSASWFRREYDRLLDEVNEVRARIYPNDPTKLIPRRKDYFHHFWELSDGFKALIDIFETPAGIDPQLAGLSEWTKPKSKFLSFAQERLGKESQIDAVGGFLNYAPAFAYAKHIDPHTSNFRYLRKRLAENAPTPGTRELQPAADVDAAVRGAQELVEQPGINNFLEFLDDYANDLAGKTNPFDRWLQKVVPGGRKTMRVVDWLNNRVKANTILGNLGSSIAQIFNVPNGVASAKLYSLPGIERTLASIFNENEPMKRSVFIKERYQQSMKDRFKMDMIEHPIVGGTERAKEWAVWLISALDEVGTKFIWNSHYAKGLAEGADDPVKYADDITRKLVAGRGVGEVPLLQKSKFFKVAAPFQLEVANAWFVMSNFVRRKDFGAIALLLAANYLMNRAAENVRGTPVVFDPINSLIEGSVAAADELEEGNETRAAIKFTGRQVGELLSNFPVGQTIAAAAPDSWVESATESISGAPIEKRELFGSADPGRFGSGLLVINGLTDPLSRLLTPFGGVQIKRTIEGIMAMAQGQVKDKEGRLSFTTEATPLNVLKAVLFGKNATSEAREFYDERDDLFQRIYRQDASRNVRHVEGEKIWAEVKELSREEAVKKLQALDESDPLLADAVADIAEAEAKGLNGTDRLIKMLNVENGERAKYIAEKVQGMKTREEKVQLLQDLDDKGLISDDVFDQLTFLLEGKL